MGCSSEGPSTDCTFEVVAVAQAVSPPEKQLQDSRFASAMPALRPPFLPSLMYYDLFDILDQPAFRRRSPFLLRCFPPLLCHYLQFQPRHSIHQRPNSFHLCVFFKERDAVTDDFFLSFRRTEAGGLGAITSSSSDSSSYSWLKREVVTGSKTDLDPEAEASP